MGIQKVHQTMIGSRVLCSLLIILSVTRLPAHAQTTEFIKRPVVGIHLLGYEFKGADSISLFGKYLKTGLALSLQNNWSARWGYCVTLEGAFIDFTNRKNIPLDNGNKQLFLQADGAIRYQLVGAGHFLQPYVQAGSGLSKFNSYYGAFMSTGTGAQLNISDQLFILVNAGYRVPLTSHQHRHFVFSIALAGPLTRKKIVKKQVALPPPTVMVAPLDSDGDGLADKSDSCPLVAGSAQYHGCPEPAPIRVIAKQETVQPVEPGEDLKKQVNLAAQHIFFKTGSFILLPTSYPALEKVASILTNDTTLHLTIEGHTDNTGTKAGNQVLSENRAKAVLQYLVHQGVPVNRLRSAGYGDQQPVADNGQVEGRAANRRVEMKLFIER